MLILETYSFRFRKGTDCYIFVFGIPAFTCLILLNIIFVKIIIHEIDDVLERGFRCSFGLI